MSVTEKQIQTGLQTAFRAMSEFADADVVINDWDVLDQSGANAPYLIIQTANDFDSKQTTREPENNFSVLVTLVEIFTTWSDTLGNLRDDRQAILDKINSNTVRSAGGLAGCYVSSVRNNGDVDYLFQTPDAQIPIYAMQELALEVEVF